MKLIKSILLIVSITILLFAITACEDNNAILQKAVDDINSDDAMHSRLEGYYRVHAEARGSSTIVVVFVAEHEDLATAEISQTISEGVTSEFQVAVEEMRNAGISDPKVVLEFFDSEDVLIYNHIFS